MKCPQCQHEHPGDATFCLECGRRLALTCRSGRIELPAGAKFCKACGQPVTPGSATGVSGKFASPEAYTAKHLAEKILSSKSALEGERKQVTVLFADLKGSMALLADRDPEEARKILDPVLEQMMEAVHRHEDTVNQVMGDGIMTLFGAPLAHEDHAVRAGYAALRVQALVKRYVEDVRRREGVVVQIRAGLNSGGRRSIHWQRSQNGLHGGWADDALGRADGTGHYAGGDPHLGRDPATGGPGGPSRATRPWRSR